MIRNWHQQTSNCAPLSFFFPYVCSACSHAGKQQGICTRVVGRILVGTKFAWKPSTKFYKSTNTMFRWQSSANQSLCKPLRNPVNSSCQMLPMTTGDPPANQKGQILSNLYPYKRYKPLVQQEENQKILIRKSQLNRNEWNTGLLRPVSSNSGASALAEGETWSPCVSPCMSTSILIFSGVQIELVVALKCPK